MDLVTTSFVLLITSSAVQKSNFSYWVGTVDVPESFIDLLAEQEVLTAAV